MVKRNIMRGSLRSIKGRFNNTGSMKELNTNSSDSRFTPTLSFKISVSLVKFSSYIPYSAYAFSHLPLERKCRTHFARHFSLKNKKLKTNISDLQFPIHNSQIGSMLKAQCSKLSLHTITHSSEKISTNILLTIN